MIAKPCSLYEGDAQDLSPKLSLWAAHSEAFTQHLPDENHNLSACFGCTVFFPSDLQG